MNSRAELIFEQTRKLPAEDRAALAGELLETVDPFSKAIADDLAAEIKARLKAFDEGTDQAEPAADVLRAARGHLESLT